MHCKSSCLELGYGKVYPYFGEPRPDHVSRVRAINFTRH